MMVMLLMAQQLEKPQNCPNRRHTFYRQERCPYVEIAKK